MGKPQRYNIHGRMMTLAEIADELGITVRTLYNNRYKYHAGSYQALWDMYRDGEINHSVRTGIKHRVHGRVTTVRREAARLGISIGNLETWRTLHRHPDGSRALLEEAVDYFMDLKIGVIQRKPSGYPAKKHWVNGKKMTIAEAAAKVGVSEKAMRSYMYRHHCRLETAYRRTEERKRKQAERKIMRTLGF